MVDWNKILQDIYPPVHLLSYYPSFNDWNDIISQFDLRPEDRVIPIKQLWHHLNMGIENDFWTNILVVPEIPPLLLEFAVLHGKSTVILILVAKRKEKLSDKIFEVLVSSNNFQVAEELADNFHLYSEKHFRYIVDKGSWGSKMKLVETMVNKLPASIIKKFCDPDDLYLYQGVITNLENKDTLTALSLMGDKYARTKLKTLTEDQ